MAQTSDILRRWLTPVTDPEYGRDLTPVFEDFKVLGLINNDYMYLVRCAQDIDFGVYRSMDSSQYSMTENASFPPHLQYRRTDLMQVLTPDVRYSMESRTFGWDVARIAHRFLERSNEEFNLDGRIIPIPSPAFLAPEQIQYAVVHYPYGEGLPSFFPEALSRSIPPTVSHELEYVNVFFMRTGDDEWRGNIGAVRTTDGSYYSFSCRAHEPLSEELNVYEELSIAQAAMESTSSSMSLFTLDFLNELLAEYVDIDEPMVLPLQVFETFTGLLIGSRKDDLFVPVLGPITLKTLEKAGNYMPKLLNSLDRSAPDYWDLARRAERVVHTLIRLGRDTMAEETLKVVKLHFSNADI